MVSYSRVRRPRCHLFFALLLQSNSLFWWLYCNLHSPVSCGSHFFALSLCCCWVFGCGSGPFVQSFLEELRRGGSRWPAAAFCLAASRTQTQSLAWQAQYTELHCSSQPLTAPLLTGPLLITTHHNLSHPNSSQFHFSHHFSHLTYHTRSHHSSTSHTWHHKSTSHTSLLIPPRSSH